MPVPTLHCSQQADILSDSAQSISKRRSTSRWPLLVIAAVAFLSAQLLAWWSRDPRNHGLVAAYAYLDLGELRQQTQRNLQFPVTNRSPDVQIIKHVGKSCSCTNVELSTRRLSPGESALVSGQFDSGRIRGRTTSKITLIYHAQDSPEDLRTLDLAFSADVAPTVVVIPEKLEFGLSAGPQTKVLAVASRSGAPVVVRDAKCTHAAFDAEFDNVQHTVKVRFEPTKWQTEMAFPDLILHF